MKQYIKFIIIETDHYFFLITGHQPRPKLKKNKKNKLRMYFSENRKNMFRFNKGCYLQSSKHDIIFTGSVFRDHAFVLFLFDEHAYY